MCACVCLSVCLLSCLSLSVSSSPGLPHKAKIIWGCPHGHSSYVSFSQKPVWSLRHRRYPVQCHTSKLCQHAHTHTHTHTHTLTMSMMNSVSGLGGQNRQSQLTETSSPTGLNLQGTFAVLPADCMLRRTVLKSWLLITERYLHQSWYLTVWIWHKNPDQNHPFE